MTADVIESLRRSAMRQYGFGTEEMKRTKVCAFCGARLSAEVKTCTECGRKVPKQTLFDLYKEHHACCRFCDTVLTENAHYCPQCGRRAERGTAPKSDKKSDGNNQAFGF